jgi:hypothetical protein
LRWNHIPTEAHQLQENFLTKENSALFSCNTQAAWIYSLRYENKQTVERLFCGHWQAWRQGHVGSQDASRPRKCKKRRLAERQAAQTETIKNAPPVVSSTGRAQPKAEAFSGIWGDTKSL